MPVINILAPHVADMIAAGEVVERPASVIKELMENAFDAGAKNIRVEIKDGGATYIRVTDDGCGMSPEDAGVAFMRHATSKLKDEKGLEAIATMGFRGEALAAISAVSKIELVTRRKGDAAGTRVSLVAGDIQDMGSVGCPEGTTMTVRELFYNTPARLKFMKSDRSEASACALAALRCALGRPEVSVRFIRDGKEEFFSPGDGKAESCIYSLLGRDIAKGMLPCESSDEKMKLTGFVSSPAAGRGNRSAQYFFCNGRFIKSAMLQAAVEQAYKNSLLTGRFPACVLYLDISWGSVDVNVHPAKIEVKFADEKKVFDLVYYAVRSALSGESKPVEAELSPSTKKVIEPKKDFYQSMKAEDFRKNNYSAKSSAPTVLKAPSAPAYREPAPVFKPKSAPVMSVKPQEYHEQIRMELPVKPPAAPKTEKFVQNNKVEQAVKHENVENSVQNVGNLPTKNYKIAAEVLKTYIIVEEGDELVLIDKHAAHERMIFDRLKARDTEIMSQTLLSSVTLKLSGEDSELIEENGELLSELGFEIEPFGDAGYVLRAVPADMAGGDAAAAIEEICEKLRGGKAPDAKSARDEILHTVACKAAIKAGWDTHRKELELLVDEVMCGRVKYCPHGRPVAVRLTRKELDKQFRRIV